MLNVDGWTDERTNGRKLACLCLPAKAGATKSVGGVMVFILCTLSDYALYLPTVLCKYLKGFQSYRPGQ